MKELVLSRHSALVTAAFLLLLAGWAGAQPTYTFTVSLTPGQVTEDGGYDTWLTPWQTVGYTLPPGGKVKFDVVLPPGQRIDTTDGYVIDGNESIHVNVHGHYPPGTTPPAWPDNQLQVDYWLTGVVPADPGPRVPTPAHPWTSNNTPYPAVVDPGSGNIAYEHDYNMGTADFSFTDVHAELTATSLASASGYVIDEVQIGFNRDNIYIVTPEPATLSLLALGGAALLRRRSRG